MSNPNQAPQAPQSQSQTVMIRMKPNCGRMLIGRKWQLSDGTIVDTLPKDPQERLNPVDVYLDERTQDRDGQWSEGPTAEVPLTMLRPMLKDGKPVRQIEGYAMQRNPGSEEEQINGEKRQLRDDFSPGNLQAIFSDATFEIVRKVS